MSIKRYVANKDTTITNAYKSNMRNVATASNMGEADTMEIFSIYGQAYSSSSELSRILVEFPTSDISTDRTTGIIPRSGSVNFYLKLYNAEHSFTVPRKITLKILPISRSWDEGFGLDLDNYTDSGSCNWDIAYTSSTGYVSWTSDGGDYHTGSYVSGSTLPSYSVYMERGYENIDLDITSLVEEWLANVNGEATTNHGIGVMLTSSIETAPSSSYTKRFFARGSEFFFYRPRIEARWDSSTKDRRGSFFASSSLAPAADNENTIYFYNYIRGQLKNIPSITTGAIYVRPWTDRISGSLISTTVVTGGYYSTGIYTASVTLDTTASYIYDRWYNSSLTTCFHTGTIKVETFEAYQYNPNPKYVISMSDVKSVYSPDETARFRIFVRQKGWNPNIYVKATSDVVGQIIEDIYYKVERVVDNFIAVNYGTGSLNETRLSYDVSGSYFDFDMDLLEPGYMYNVSFLFNDNGLYREQEEKFKFRVE